MSIPRAVREVAPPGRNRFWGAVTYSEPSAPVGFWRETKNRALVTARCAPSEGLFCRVKALSTAPVAPKVVEPPPSNSTASTQPSSLSRAATCFMDAPTLWPLCRPSMV